MTRMCVPRGDYLSVEQSTALKGLLALGVLFSHAVPASGLVKGSILSPLIGSLGYLCVAVFFFLSGYGIMAQYQAKKEKYLKNFLKNRVLSIYFLTLFLILVYGVFRKLVRVPIIPIDLLQSFFVGNTIVSNGWYLQIVILFYLFWFFTTKYIKKERMQFGGLCILVLGYMLFGIFYMSHFWFQSSFGFLLGVFWLQNKNKIDDWLFQNRKHPVIVMSLAFVFLGVTYFLATKGMIVKDKMLNGIFRSVMSCLSALMFVVVILMLNIICKKILNCGVLRFLGKFSMEIYVLQGIPLHIFAKGALRIENDWLYILSVVAVTLLLAVAMHPVIRFITNIPKKYL